jgi:hypothetical protein
MRPLRYVNDIKRMQNSPLFCSRTQLNQPAHSLTLHTPCYCFTTSRARGSCSLLAGGRGYLCTVVELEWRASLRDPHVSLRRVSSSTASPGHTTPRRQGARAPGRGAPGLRCPLPPLEEGKKERSKLSSLYLILPFLVSFCFL